MVSFYKSFHEGFQGLENWGLSVYQSLRLRNYIVILGFRIFRIRVGFRVWAVLRGTQIEQCSLSVLCACVFKKAPLYL